MSKNQTTKQTTQTNNPAAKKKALVVIIICVVTAIVIAASLIIALYEPPVKTPADLDNGSQESSSDTIRNGDFQYVSDSQASYPKAAQNWSKYTYKNGATATSQGYQKIFSNADTVMGVVDTEDWTNVQSDLSAYGVGSLTNPNTREGSEDHYVYMIHNKVAYNASIYSQSFSIPANTSVKITVWLMTVGVDSNTGAFVMIKQNSSSALEKTTTGTQNWYAHTGVVADYATTTDGEWEKVELHVFNRTSSSKTVYANIGLGNIYNNTNVAGTLFVDDVQYETVTADDYRQYVQAGAGDTKAYAIENTDEAVSPVTNTLTYTVGNSGGAATTQTTADYLASDLSKAGDIHYSPFYDTANIASLTNDGTQHNPVYLLSSELKVNPPITGDHYQISVWIRVINNDNKLNGAANLYLYNANNINQQYDSLASFATIQTESDIAEDATNGWLQYNFYIKPSNTETTLKLKVTLGDEKGYGTADNPAIPTATVLVTEPVVTTITNSQYASASTGTYVSKTELTSNKATTSISNGSFSDIVNNSQTGTYYAPSNWTPVFAGAVEIFNNGLDVIKVDDTSGAVSSGIVFGNANAPDWDDSARGILSITNNRATSFGYLSNTFTLPAKTVSVVSVLVNNDGGNPNVYLLDGKKDGLLLHSTNDKQDVLDSDLLTLPATSGNWERHYFVYVTGDSSITVKLALFNGTIDATAETGTTGGTVYFDQAMVQSIGTFVRDNSQEELFQQNDDGDFVKDDNGNFIRLEDKIAEITYTGSLYTDFEVREFVDSLLDDNGEVTKKNLVVVDKSIEDVAEPEEAEDEEEEEETPTEPTVDTVLLVSIISSALLVAALLMVVIFKFLFKKKN